MPKNKTIQAPCNDCCQDTEHHILKSHAKSGADSETSWKVQFDMLECCGCHAIKLKRSFDFSEYPEVAVSYFPPASFRRKPSWENQLFMHVPASSNLPALLTEVYSAIHADNRRLATMGTRALLDMTIMDTVGDVGSFNQKLNALQHEGYITGRQLTILDAALDTGNAASHRGHQPSPEELNTLMDIVENIIQQIYILPNVVAELKKSTPQRKRKQSP